MTVIRSKRAMLEMDKMSADDVMTIQDKLADRGRWLLFAAARFLASVKTTKNDAVRTLEDFRADLIKDPSYAMERSDRAMEATVSLHVFGISSGVGFDLSLLSRSVQVASGQFNAGAVCQVAQTVMSIRDAILKIARLSQSGLTSSSASTRAFAQAKIAFCLDITGGFGEFSQLTGSAQQYLDLLLPPKTPVVEDFSGDWELPKAAREMWA